MREINLLESTPKIKRNLSPNWRTEKNKIIAKRFDKEFFDGDRINGYGGYYYDGRWKEVAKKLQETYELNRNISVLDIGCAKGFLLYDLQETIPGIKVAGIDISKYAINHAMEGYGHYMRNKKYEEDPKNLEKIARKKILPYIIQGSADKLPYADNSFDLVLNINTIHNLPIEKCKTAIKEMIRVGKNKENMFIQVDSYRNEKERKIGENYILTAKTVMSEEDWISLFKEQGYNGDYFWTIFKN